MQIKQRIIKEPESIAENSIYSGGSCSVCVPLYITKRSEAVLQWGKRKNIKKMMINGELVIE